MALFATTKRLKTSFLSQWLVELGAIFLQMQSGGMSGWPSPFLARLTSPGSSIPLTSSDASWVVSLYSLGHLVGVIPATLCIYHLGSRKTSAASLGLFAISYIFIIQADSIVYLCLFRLVGGIGVEMGTYCCSIFLGEIRQPKNRGAIISATYFGSSVARLISSFLGSRFSLATFGFFFLLPTSVGFAIFYNLPESPHLLVSSGDIEGARKVLTWYRDSDDVNSELAEIRDYVALSKATTFKEKLAELKLPHNRKIIFILMALFTVGHGTGLHTLLMNTELILRRAKFHLIQPANAVVLMNALGIISVLISTLVIDRCGRRFMTIISSLGMALATTILGTHFLLLDRHVDPEQLQYLPVISIILFNSSYVSGMVSIPFTVLSEILPLNVKFLATFIIGIYSSGISFLTAKSYQPMVDLVGDSYVLFGHAAFTILAVPFAIFVMPETKGKSLNDIQMELMKCTFPTHL